QTIPYINKAIINSYQTRKMIITVMPTVVFFTGQVGTLDELMTTIGWIKSLLKQNAQPPNLWVDDYWWDVLDLLNNKNAIQENVWAYIHKFKDVDEILKSLN
ncbi:MAG: LOG family protein, partial [Patescibacteria group bacterium]